MNVFDLLDIASSIVPARTSLVTERSDEARFTFAETRDRVRRTAGALKSLGVRAGDRVALMDVNGPAHVEFCFACGLLGAVFVPLNYRAKMGEIAWTLAEIGPRAVVGGSRYVPLLKQARREAKSSCVGVSLGDSHEDWYGYEASLGPSSPVDSAPQRGDTDAAMIMFTSGTSSHPRGVVLSHASFCSFVMANVTPADPGPHTEERNILSAPLHHVAGAQALMSSVYAGRTLVLQPQFEPEGWLALAERERVNRAMLVPTMLKSLLECPKFEESDLSSLRVITYGAAAMPERVLAQALDKLPHVQFINAFGQTETAATITMLSPEDHDLSGPSDEREKRRRRLTSIGKPLPDVEVCIVDKKGGEVAPGEVGEIVARGERLMKGYWNQPEATAAAVHNGWLHTGDLGWEDEDGYIFLAGRGREFIKRGGEMISPEEVEEVLEDHPAVAEAAIIGLPDETWGEMVHAVVVAAPGACPAPEALIEHCRERLAGYKKPEAVHFVDELPKSQLGKVMKGELRERFHGIMRE